MGTIVFAVIIGVAVGVVVGALGAGGGILAVPALTYLLHQSPHAAATGSLVIVLATALVAIPEKVRKKTIRIREGLVFGAISVVGSFIGARLSAYVDGNVLMLLFAAMLAIMAIVMTRKGLRERKISEGEPAPRKPRGWPWVIVAATLTGFLTGFFGVGGGFMVVPVLTLVLAFGMREAAGTSLIIMVLASAAGLASRYGQSIPVDWEVVLGFMFGSMAGGIAGGPLSNKAKPHQLTLIFAALLAVVCIASLAATLTQMLAA
ncbi:MAG: sulfite exporter TauE/SafE family protein [Actinomycetaceae bacterium]|nr:sulfite exporter TauE/SafE family protein [Actinomycetaceae bacterium]